MIAKALLLVALLGLCASSTYGATMTMKNGKVIDLDKLYQDAKGKCCLTAQEIGLMKESGDNTIVRMDGSGGKYFVTNDPKCGNVIYSSSYPTSFTNVYLCGQCKGGCPQVDGGKTLVPAGGSCVKSDGTFDITKQCIASHPVCMSPGSGKCVTTEEAAAKPPAPAPAATCASFAQLGQPCNNAAGQCCGGAPKNAKCENGKCATTYPTGRRLWGVEAAAACATFAQLGQNCNDAAGQCCGGAPKNAKCENGKCVTTYPTPPPAPAPAPAGGCASFAQLGQPCNDKAGQCCGGAPKNAKCESGKCVSTYPTPPPAPAPAPAGGCASFAQLDQPCNDAAGQCCGGAPKNAKCENGKCVSTYPSGRRL